MADELRRKRLFTVETDAITKIMLIVFVTIVSYFAFFMLLRSLLYGQPRSIHEMMQGMMYYETYMVLLNLGSLSLAFGVGLFFFFTYKDEIKERR